MEILDGTVIAPAAPHIAADLGVAGGRGQRRDHRLRAHPGRADPDQRLADRPVRGPPGLRHRASRSSPLASVGCAAAANLPMLIATRVLQGVGGAMMVPVGRLVVLRTTAKTDLVRAIAYLTWPALVAPVVAPGARRGPEHLRVLAVDLRDQRAARAWPGCCWPAAWCRTCAPTSRRRAGLARVRAHRGRRRRAGGRPGGHRRRGDPELAVAAVALALAAVVARPRPCGYLLRAPRPLLDLRILRMRDLPGHRARAARCSGR